MATSSSKPEYKDPLASLSSILDLFSGKTSVTTTSPSTITESTRSNITQDQLAALIAGEMAPLNQASKGSGLSAYGDTTLALGRGEVAANVAAKYAGSTTTRQSSGETRTTTSPGPLSGDRIGDTAGNLILMQLASPFAKKLTKQGGFIDGISDAIDKGADAVINPIADWGRDLFSGSTASSEIASDFVGPPISAMETGLIDTATEYAGDALSDIGDSISSGFDWFKDFLGFAEGGYVDRHVASTNLQDQSLASPKLSASGDIAPATNAAKDLILSKVASDSIRDGGSAADRPTSTKDRMPPEYEGKLNDLGFKALGLGLLGLTPIGGLYSNAASISNKVLGTSLPTLMGTVGDIVKTRKEAIAVQGILDGIAGSVAAAGGVQVDTRNVDGSYTAESGAVSRGIRADGISTSDLGSAEAESRATGIKGDSIDSRDLGPAESGGSDNSSADSDSGGWGGESRGFTAGGKVRGPGTSTSDSIAAHLSDGEYVIDAKTVRALGPEFFQAIQAKFNPAAIQSQAMKGRL
jgi:hypothetical protein